MGELIFQIISSDRLGAESIRITGTWKLIRAEDSPGGYFTLIWKKIDNNWVIVYDHTS